MTSAAVLAPEAVAALLHAEGIARACGDPLAWTAVEAVLSGGADVVPEDPDEAVVHAFAQQVVLDVAGVTEAQRADALRVLGRRAFGFVQTIYVADVGTRARLALFQLLGEELPDAEPLQGELWPAVEELMRTIARMSELDAVTTELVRLRGARAHACRVCQSLRDTRALAAGADEDLFVALDQYEDSTLPERQKEALRIVDAMIWTPRDVPLPAQLSEREGVEVVLDVVRNAGNKVAVAFGADAARVTEGVELYTVSAEGEPVYSR